jgi:LacI family transcriptional regulator
MRDVAKEAGVAFKTVSRVINDEPNVSAGTREKVEKAIEKLHFTPNLIARSLNSKRIMNLGIVVGWPIDSFYTSQLINETFKACTMRGYNLNVFSTATDATEAQNRILTACAGGIINGLVLDTISGINSKFIEKLTKHETPFVIVHPHDLTAHANHDYVTIDDFQGAKTAVSYLISLGHKKIGCIIGNTYQEGIDRFNGYKTALQEANLEVQSGLFSMQEGESAFFSGYKNTKEILKKNKKLTAFFCESDETALGTINALLQLGFRVPDDISVIGFDDNHAASMIIPPLTTVHQPIDEIATKAVEMLVKRVENTALDQPHVILPTRLVIRGSSKAI